MKALDILTRSVVLLAILSMLPVPAAASDPAPAGVEEILLARQFTLQQGYTYQWNHEKPTVTEGTILVFRVDAELVRPRQAAEPVLYVGGHTAQRMNHAYPSGVLLAIVPARVDLSRTPIWFGAPELPERVTASMRAQELARAEAAGIHAFDGTLVRAAEEQGGPVLELKDTAELDEVVRELYLRFVR